jgi:hypothetical protein
MQTAIKHKTRRAISWLTILGSGLFMLLFFSGCYTQLVALQSPHGGLDEVVTQYEDDGDVVVRKYYEDGYVDEDVYDSYDWYNHEPYAYSRYFDSFYGYGYAPYDCWDIFYCRPLSSFYSPGWSMSFGYGMNRGWGYSSFGFGYGYGSYGYGYGGYGYGGYGYGGYGAFGYGNSYPYYGGGVSLARGNVGARGATMARSALTSLTDDVNRGGRGSVSGNRSGLAG